MRFYSEVEEVDLVPLQHLKGSSFVAIANRKKPLDIVSNISISDTEETLDPP